ncbi:MAG: CinA family protein [Spirochaetaceae bacterium]|jgi:PncC family amidohydrolase|nr:CinA family protein [Spirochaetaceae bacterium]
MMDIEVELVEALKARALRLVCAESCTAGLVAAALARVPGASAVLWGAFVCYTLDAKEKMLGLRKTLLECFGAVSGETACAMAEAALEKSDADIAVSVTGLAGPDGDGSENPVGTVWVGFCKRGGKPEAKHYHFTGTREEIRHAACNAALEMLLLKVDGDEEGG